MPSIQSPLGALPSRFRRERVLIVGCGDIGLRVARALGKRVLIRALTSSPGRVSMLRGIGITPLLGNLDDSRSLGRLAALGTRVLHLAPPAIEEKVEWWRDRRTAALLRALRRRSAPVSLVYASTSGVYGDCAGQKVTEARPIAPRTPRSQRRADAERAVRHFGRSRGNRSTILRVPGIYAADRPGGTPRERLLKRVPVLEARDDVYTNHVHSDDLARLLVAALWRGAAQRVYNANDDTEMKMGDYFDLAADVYGLPRPPRVPRSTAQEHLPLMLLSFMGESRRMDNSRLKRELKVALRYPTVHAGLRPGGRSTRE